MSDTSTQAQIGEVSSSSSGPINMFASPTGSVFFDVVLPSALLGDPRPAIRDSFIQQVVELTGLDKGAPLGGLCEFMFEPLTLGNTMPPHGDKMETELNGNEGYLAKIKAYCTLNGGGAGTIGEYEATLDIGGTDFYCIGTDGYRYCYHFFELKPKTGSSADPITIPDPGEFRICCVGKLEQ